VTTPGGRGRPRPSTKHLFIGHSSCLLLGLHVGTLGDHHGVTPRQVWVNVVHAVDGRWGIAGRRYDNAALVDAIPSAAAVP